MNLIINEPLPMTIPTYYIGVKSFLKAEMRDWIDSQPSLGRVWAGGHGLHFECEQDATAFALRWA